MIINRAVHRHGQTDPPDESDSKIDQFNDYDG